MAQKRETIAIIGEGITEKYYVLSLRDYLKIKPTAVKPKNSSLKELEIAIKGCLKKGYDRIYCMIDCDNKVYDGNPDHERNAAEYGLLKRKYHARLHKCADGNKALVVMVESFPATEIFFLYYFGFTNAYYGNQQLKNLLHQRFGYLTEEKYLIKHSIHETIVKAGGSLEAAIKASEQSVAMRPPDDMHSSFT